GGAWTNNGADLNGGTFQHNVATTGSGGGLMVFGGELALPRTELVSNSTLVGDGAGLYHFGGGSARLVEPSLRDNASKRSRGGAYFEGDLALDGATVVSNTAVVNGGGVYAGSTTVLTGGYF